MRTFPLIWRRRVDAKPWRDRSPVKPLNSRSPASVLMSEGSGHTHFFRRTEIPAEAGDLKGGYGRGLGRRRTHGRRRRRGRPGRRTTVGLDVSSEVLGGDDSGTTSLVVGILELISSVVGAIDCVTVGASVMATTVGAAAGTLVHQSPKRSSAP